MDHEIDERRFMENKPLFVRITHELDPSFSYELRCEVFYKGIKGTSLQNIIIKSSQEIIFINLLNADFRPPSAPEVTVVRENELVNSNIPLKELLVKAKDLTRTEAFEQYCSICGDWLNVKHNCTLCSFEKALSFATISMKKKAIKSHSNGEPYIRKFSVRSISW